MITYPLFGVICNCNGSKEKNYLYTSEEMQRYNNEAWHEALYSQDNTSKGTFTTDKTYIVKLIKDKETLTDFLNFKYNNDYLRENQCCENTENNDLFGELSDTLKNTMQSLDETLYFVVTIAPAKPPDTEIFNIKVVGVFSILDKAEYIIKNNVCYIGKKHNNMIVIEEIKTGLYPAIENQIWYEFNTKTKKYERTKKPDYMKMYGGFSIG